MPADLMLAVTPVVTGLVAAVGAAIPALPRRAYPLLAVMLGVAWMTAARLVLGAWTWSAPLEGVIVGLSAAGLYSGAVKPALAIADRRS